MTLEKDEILNTLPKGKLVVAVSGGVDSVVLLHVLAKRLNGDRILVAHLDHGIRKESVAEARFVKALADSYGLEFHYTSLGLGSGASEAQARDARYAFLNSVMDNEGAEVIVSAHHRGDVIETMAMNLLRGTNRRGLTSLGSSAKLFRPLIGVTKKELYDYALEHRLEFVEDDSNQNTKFRRNWVRRVGLPRLRQEKPSVDDDLSRIYESSKILNLEIDKLAMEIAELVFNGTRLNRKKFRILPQIVRREVIMQILTSLKVDMMNIGRGDIERLDEFICNAKSAKKFNPTKQIHFLTSRDFVDLRLQN